MIKEILKAAGVPHRQGRFPSPPGVTYAVYFDNIDNDNADPVSTSRARLPGLRYHNASIELYEPKPDDKAEASIESELDARGVSWAKQDRYWIQDSQAYQVVYEFEFITKN